MGQQRASSSARTGALFSGSFTPCAAEAALVPPVAASTASTAVAPRARTRRRTEELASACAAATVAASETSLTAGSGAYDIESIPALSLNGETPYCVSDTVAPGAKAASAAVAAAVVESDGGGCAPTTAEGRVTLDKDMHGFSAGESVTESGVFPTGDTAALVIALPQ